MSVMITPTGYGETREINLSKIQCDWCYGTPAAWKINEPCSLDGVAYACTMHGTEWYPHLFPESETDSIETIIASIPDRNPVGTDPDMIKRPYYPLIGHRDGLRANDLVTLASAFWILALEGGTAIRAQVK